MINPIHRSLIPITLLLHVSAGPGAADVPDLLGWADRVVQYCQTRETSFHRLEITAGETDTASGKARLSLDTPGRLHQFGQLLALAAGPSDSSRTPERIWQIRFPVRTSFPVVQEGELRDLPSVAQAVDSMAHRLSGDQGPVTTQLQLHRAQKVGQLPGVTRVPFGLTLIAGDNRELMAALRAMIEERPFITWHSILLVPAGEKVLGTLKGTLLVQPGKADLSAGPGVNAAGSVASALASNGLRSAPLKVDRLPDSTRVHFEAEAGNPAPAWKSLTGLLRQPELQGFELLELSIKSETRTTLSGLLYF